MSGNYIPLYRKYRPQTLDTLVGQEHIKKTLTSAIELGKISHAYLFTGPRGTGKTSTARILAKSLNCKNGPTIHPCGECESCKDIINSIPIDVIEIDAASNRSVDDAHEILEKIMYAPVNGKYKIYIIDEVHMLSNAAFNALLKTLEEPPENVIFILATTEVHKVLDTIKSRCQRFDFRRITTDDIVKHLRKIADTEKIKISDDALFAIAKNSAGGMRDSLSLLDQLSILGITEEIDVNDVNSMLGRISFDVLHKISDKIISSSPSEAIEILNDIYNSGNEPLQILTNLCEYFKNLLITKNCSKSLLSELTGLNDPQIEEISEQAKKLETQQIVFLIERTSYYIKEVKMASNQHLWLEVSMIDLANMTENSALIDLQNRLNTLESGERPTAHIQQATGVTRPSPVQPEPVHKNIELKTETEAKSTAETKATPDEEFTPPPMSKKSDTKDLNALWQAILSNITATSTQGPLKQLATPVKIDEDGVIITFSSEFWVNSINKDEARKTLIKEAIVKVLGKEVPLTVKLSSASDKKVTEAQSKEHVEQPEKKTKKITPQENTVNKQDTITAEKPTEKHSKTDQEKMILDLFDGKYVE